jgi:hypothetical protein
MCKIPPEKGERILKEKREQNPVIDSDFVNDVFPTRKFFEREMNDILITEITNKERMMKLIRKSDNLSTPG